MKKNLSYSAIYLIIFITFSCTHSPVLREGAPSSVNVSAERLSRIDRMLQQGIDSGWIGGAVGFIARDGRKLSIIILWN